MGARTLELVPVPRGLANTVTPSLSVKGSDIAIILRAAEFRERIFELVRSAKRRIYIAALYLQDDEVGRRLVTELFEAKQRDPGLDIKILVDFHRAQRGLIGAKSQCTNADLYRAASRKYEHQIDIVGVPVKKRELFGVLHVKGFIFDDTVLYSGASLSNVYLANLGRYRYDRYHEFRSPALADCMVRFLKSTIFDSPAVVPLFHEGIQGIKTMKGEVQRFVRDLRASRYEFSDMPASRDEVRVTPLVGCGPRRNRLNAAILDMIRGAQDELRVYTPYFNPPGVVLRELRRAMKRGVQVSIVLGDKTANDFYTPPDQPTGRVGIIPYMYETFLRKYLRRNQAHLNTGLLQVYLWQHEDNSFHLKGLSRDGNRHLVTGSNLNFRAWKLDLENGLLIDDPQKVLFERFEQEHREIIRHTQQVKDYRHVEDLSQYPKNVRRYIRRAQSVKAEQLLRRLL